MWLEQSRQGLGRGVRKEIRKVIGGKIVCSLTGHFKDFDFELSDMRSHGKVLTIVLMFKEEALDCLGER